MKQEAYLIADAIDKARKQASFFQRMQQSAKEKAAPETGNFPAQVSLNLKIEDVAHLLDDEQSILATPTNTLTFHFGDIFLGFFLHPQTIHRS